MKIKKARLYQAIPIGPKNETFLTTEKGLPGYHEELELSFEQGFLTIRHPLLDLPRLVPTANIMFMDAEVESGQSNRTGSNKRS